jgi:hypothetical protein
MKAARNHVLGSGRGNARARHAMSAPTFPAGLGISAVNLVAAAYSHTREGDGDVNPLSPPRRDKVRQLVRGVVGSDLTFFLVFQRLS